MEIEELEKGWNNKIESKNKIIEGLLAISGNKEEEIQILQNCLSYSTSGKETLIEAKDKIWDMINEKILQLRLCANTLWECENIIISNLDIDINKMIPLVEEILKYVDSIIDRLNSLRNQDLEALDFFDRDNCIISLTMVKESKK